MRLRLLPALTGQTYRDFRRRVIFSCHKWDPQVEDVNVIAPFALALDAEDWRALAQWSQLLAAETLACEQALWERPDLHAALGLPWRVRLALRSTRSSGPPQAAARVMRFDFHPTSTGWQLSEVNSDVPGGYNEASGLTALMAEHHAGLRTAGDPADRIARTLAACAEGGSVALVHCSAYSDDRQVMEFLGDRLRERGVASTPCAPDALNWNTDRALDGAGRPYGALLRFFPAEWLVRLPLRSRWWRFFAGQGTPAMNPGSAILTQSKRLPLVWDRLGVPCPTWRALLPETREAARAPHLDEQWLLKPAWGRVGEGVLGSGYGLPQEWSKAMISARRHPSWWIAQRRFSSLPLDGPEGPLHACIGVYTVDGVVAGIYGRTCATPRIDKLAQDVAVLIHQPLAERDGAVPDPRKGAA